MAVDRRRSRRALQMLCGVLAGVLSLTMPITANNPCEELRAWAAATYSDRTPTLDELASLARSRRVAAFGAVSASVRAALFQEHLHRTLNRPDLTRQQRALIEEGVTLATPALYEQEPNAVAAVAALRPRVESAFDTGGLRRIWFDLGTSDLRGVLTPSLVPDCNCNRAEDDCWYVGGSCGGTGCMAYVPGCGFFLNAACNGRCE